MTRLAFNALLSPVLRPGIQFGLAVLPIALMLGGLVPVYLMVDAFEQALGIAPGVSIKSHPMGIWWIAILVATMLALMIAGYLLGWLANAALCRYVRGWPREKVDAVFRRSEVPAAWFKMQHGRPPAAAGQAVAQAVAAWETQRHMGWLRFSVKRGLLAWGAPMFIGTYAIPAYVNQGFALDKLAINLAIWCLGGLAFGACLWHASESSYRKATRCTQPE